MDDRSHRTDLSRFVVIVDQKGRIVARESTSDPAFAPYNYERLPHEVESLAKRAEPCGQTHVLSTGCLMHVVPIHGTGRRLRALVFEELRVRPES